ncbi:hypothetical protein PIB30_083940, partial [Stylosanthes scabra]|nr:hypothetical protein [Stylosanthes scabra]
MSKETEFLSRLAANHLHLAQFEPLRAVLLALRPRNRDLARRILQTLVARSGRFHNILWSPSCPSPSLLTYLSTLELLQFDDASSPWGFDSETLRFRAEFLLFVQNLIDLVPEPSDDEEFRSCRRVLDAVLELGVKRLRVDGDGDGDDDVAGDVERIESSGNASVATVVEEGELMSLMKMVLDHAGVFDALCGNVYKQIKRWESEDRGLEVTVKRSEGGGVVVEEEEEGAEEEGDVKVLGLILRTVQVIHLDAMKECLEKGDTEGAVSHIRFLHFDYGVEQSEYRIVLKDLLKAVLSRTEDFGDSWNTMRNQLLEIYSEALSSYCNDIVQMIQGIHDELLSEEIEMDRVQSDKFIPHPLVCLKRYVAELKASKNLDGEALFPSEVIRACKIEMYHYARVSGLHVLEYVMNTALSAVEREQLEEASNVLQLFPQLQPLIAAMGWDLLAGKISARRKLMQLLWTSKSQVIRLEESSLYGNKSDEISCIEHLCDTLCYQLDLSAFVACVNSGQSWSSKFSLMFSGKEQLEFGDGDGDPYSDPFVENFVLERLSVQSPLRSGSCGTAGFGIKQEVLFDVVPGIKFQEAIELISMQPIASTLEAWKRKQDIDLMHMRYALESVVLALGAMEMSISDEIENHQAVPLSHLKDLQSHLDAISSLPRKIFMVNVIISLLHMDNVSINSMHCGSPRSDSKLPNSLENDYPTRIEGANKMVISFTSLLLDILSRNIPTSEIELENALDDSVNTATRQALEWRISISKRFIEEWEWRLSILQHLLPLSERQWRWKEALTVLRAAPSKLLNLCMQKAKFDIGEAAVHRFSLSAEDKATLELAEWVDSACNKEDDVVSRVHDLDFSSLRSQLGPLATILLCIDVAATSAKSAKMSQQLLDQAQTMLSEIYPGGSAKDGSTYWDQILEVGVISVLRRLLKHLHEFLEQDNPPALQAILSGEIVITSPKESHRQEQRERALALLHQMIEDAHMDKRQFLSGKLHNLARAVADEETEPSTTSRGEGLYADRGVIATNSDKDIMLGVGLRVVKQVPLSSSGGETGQHSAGYDVKDYGKRIFAPLTAKPMTYLSQFILHVAAIGDIVDGTDTTHDFNFFSVLYEWPKDLLTRLVFERGSTDAAGKVAEILFADFVHEVISACVPPVYPPRSGNGWACIPVVPTFPKSSSEHKVLSPSSKDAKPSCYCRSSATPGVALYPLQLDLVKHLAKISPVRAVLACVFGSTILYSSSSSSISSSLNDGLLQAPDADRLFYEFALDQSERFPTLNRWIQMQTNLHRVSEVAVTGQTADDSNREARTSIKRIREHDTETESDADDIVSNSTIPVALTELNGYGVEATDFSHDSSKYESGQLDTTMFLSFDWDNEEPYEKAVERLIEEGKLMDALALSDRFLRNGASDRLLQLLIERAEEIHSNSAQRHGYGGSNVWSNSWQYCLRLKDKQLAARLALRYVHTWELDAALDVLTMCNCHLPQNYPIRQEILQMKQALQRYSHILNADDRYTSWQEVEAECKEDPEGLALRLAGKGAVSAALEVAESAGLSNDLRRELQGRQLVKLLTADPLNGGGPAEASRFLSSLRDTDDALPVAMGAMQLLPNLRSKQLLVHFFLKRREGNLSDVEISRLNSWALGLRVLAVLPVPWQQRCSALHEHPHLILEVLLMRKQLQSAALILKEFPSLRDNNVITTYSAKAIAVSINSPPREHRISILGSRPKQKARPGAPPKMSFTSSLSNLQKEARRAFSWAPKNTMEKSAPKDVYRKRKSSGLSPSDRVAWEAMTGIQE